jgi:hypothetical protein
VRVRVGHVRGVIKCAKRVRMLVQVSSLVHAPNHALNDDDRFAERRRQPQYVRYNIHWIRVWDDVTDRGAGARNHALNSARIFASDRVAPCKSD